MSWTLESVGRNSMREALLRSGYEILPFKGTYEKVLEFVPTSVRLTVTASPAKGIDATVDLSTRLAKAGYDAAPHLSARLIADAHELDDILARLNESGVKSLFVVGGDGAPRGEFSEAIQLLRQIRASRTPFADIGIGGYPEGHALIPRKHLEAAMLDKAPLADHITTQMCFDPGHISSWAKELSEHGVNLPIRVGIPGAVSRQKLLRISSTIGIGESAKFLKKQKNLFWRFLLPGGFKADKLMRQLHADRHRHANLDGFHVFTFNELEATERWRRSLIDRLS